MHKDFKNIKELKSQLGREITKCRVSKMSQRGLAKEIGLPPSNMKYIEDGVNVPTGEVYKRIINALEPSSEQRKKMDKLYMEIRKVPPPDICEVININNELFEAFRLLNGKKLSNEEKEQTEVLLKSFAERKQRG